MSSRSTQRPTEMTTPTNLQHGHHHNHNILRDWLAQPHTDRMTREKIEDFIRRRLSHQSNNLRMALKEWRHTQHPVLEEALTRRFPRMATITHVLKTHPDLALVVVGAVLDRVGHAVVTHWHKKHPNANFLAVARAAATAFRAFQQSRPQHAQAIFRQDHTPVPHAFIVEAKRFLEGHPNLLEKIKEQFAPKAALLRALQRHHAGH